VILTLTPDAADKGRQREKRPVASVQNEKKLWKTGFYTTAFILALSLA
jgi:hypothetical protein